MGSSLNALVAACPFTFISNKNTRVVTSLAIADIGRQITTQNLELLVSHYSKHSLERDGSIQNGIITVLVRIVLCSQCIFDVRFAFKVTLKSTPNAERCPF